jgi:3,4-dihydroxy 2-butanone 4-phosphate synthase / GTP cyclohydrolase II
VRLMTNNPDKVAALERYGLNVVERVAVEVPPRDANRKYMQTKRAKFGHLLSMAGVDNEAK